MYGDIASCVFWVTMCRALSLENDVSNGQAWVHPRRVYSVACSNCCSRSFQGVIRTTVPCATLCGPGSVGVPLLSGMGLGVGLGLDDGFVHGDDAVGGPKPHIDDFLPSRFAAQHDSDEAPAGGSPAATTGPGGSGGRGLDAEALWDLHERLRASYVYTWSMPITRRVLANASHVMVGGGADLGVNDQAVAGRAVESDLVPGPTSSVAVTRLLRHLYSAYQRQLFDPMVEDVPDSSDAGGISIETALEMGTAKSFEAVGSWSQGHADVLLQVRVCGGGLAAQCFHQTPPCARAVAPVIVFVHVAYLMNLFWSLTCRSCLCCAAANCICSEWVASALS